jgi:carboxylate-amine ligase
MVVFTQYPSNVNRGVGAATRTHTGRMRTFGVEEELLLVDESSGAPLAVASTLLRRHEQAIKHRPAPDLTAEMQQEMLETMSVPRLRLEDIRDDIAASRAYADGLARTAGARAVALAMSPLPALPHATQKDRYRTMMERYGTTARNSLACGFHIHVSIRSPEEGVAILDRVRTWLPLLLALSVNSPFCNGEDTGYSSYRSLSWGQWPCAGPTDVFESIEAYRAFEEQLLGSGVLLDAGMLYLDARLSRNHPTIEIRVADVCQGQQAAVTIAGLARALVETAGWEWRSGIPPAPLSASALRLASWKAALCGLGDDLVHPLSGRPRPASEMIALLFNHVEEALIETGDRDTVARGIADIINHGTGADWQRMVFRETGRLPDIVSAAADLTQSPTVRRGGSDRGRLLTVPT